MKKIITIIIISIIILIFVIKSIQILDIIKTKELERILVLVDKEQESLFGDGEIQEFIEKEFGVKLECVFENNIEIKNKISLNQGIELYDAIIFANDIDNQSVQINQKDYICKDINFKTPLVFYSWKNIVDSLISQRIVKETNGVFYVQDMNEFLNFVLEEKKWSDLGLEELNGRFKVDVTDVKKTQLGKDFFKFVSATFDNNDIEKIQRLQNLYVDSSLISDTTSKSFFEKYLKEGMNISPIIVGYEKNLLDFVNKNNPDYREVQENIRIIYPKETIYNSLNLIVINEEKNKILKIMESDFVKVKSWQNSGIRNNFTEDLYNNGYLEIGIPKKITEITSK